MVSSQVVPKSFRTILVISYPLLFSVLSFRPEFGHFVPSLVISYLLLYFNSKLFWSFRTQFEQFHTQVISYLDSFRTQLSHFVPGSFRTWVIGGLLFIAVSGSTRALSFKLKEDKKGRKMTLENKPSSSIIYLILKCALTRARVHESEL